MRHHARRPLVSTAPSPTLRWWLAFVAAAAIAALGAGIAYARLVPPFVAARGLDKVLHFAMGAILAGLLDGALRGRGVRLGSGWAAHVPLAAAAILLPAGLEEHMQRFSSSRSSSLADFAADALGVAVGIAVSRLGRRAWTTTAP